MAEQDNTQLPLPSQLFPKITPPNDEIRAAARLAQDSLTKSPGALGVLEDVGAWIAACQGVCPPKPLTDSRIVIFAGDHDISHRNISRYPTSVSVQVVENIEHGGSVVNVFARAAGASIRIVDTSLDRDAYGTERVSRSCPPIDREDAMDAHGIVRALTIGQRVCDECVDSGADILIPGEVGIGNTTVAAALIGSGLDKEPVVVVGRGTGIDDDAWKVKVSIVRDAMFRTRDVRHSPVEFLRRSASPDIAAMVGFLAQAAVRRTPVLLDGLVSAAAALWANRLAPGARAWWWAATRSTEPAQEFALNELGLTPLLDIGLHAGEGSGAAAALPLVQASAAVFTELATFESAHMVKHSPSH